MNIKAEITIQSFLIGILVIGLFFGLLGGLINIFTPDYNMDGMNLKDIEKYQIMDNLSQQIKNIEDKVTDVTPDKNVFDFFADIFSRLLTPITFTYKAIKTSITMSQSITDDLGLFPVFRQFFTTLITIIVIIGIVMIKFYLGRKK